MSRTNARLPADSAGIPDERVGAFLGPGRCRLCAWTAVREEDSTMVAEGDTFEASRAMRRAMLGDAYVDAQTSDPNPAMGEFSDYITSMAWGVWTRGGALSTRDRSLVVLAMTAALGRMDEFRLHVSARSRTGVTDDELDELLFQVAAYCGAPAGVSAKRALLAERAEEQTEV